MQSLRVKFPTVKFPNSAVQLNSSVPEIELELELETDRLLLLLFVAKQVARSEVAIARATSAITLLQRILSSGFSEYCESEVNSAQR